MPVFLFKKLHFLMKPMNLEKFTDSYFLPYSFTLQQKHLENCYYMNYRREIRKSVLGTLLVSVVLLIACNADVIDSPGVCTHPANENRSGSYRTEVHHRGSEHAIGSEGV